MSSSISFARASAVIPLELWLLANGRPAGEILLAAGLPSSPSAAPDRLISFHCFLDIMTLFAATEGPDFGIRVATPEAFLSLGTPARAYLASYTIREALMRIGRSFHLHASHVFFLVNPVPGGVEISESIPLPGSVEMHHQAQQHVAGLVCCLGLLAMGRPLPCRMRIAAHPVFGIDHLKPYLGEEIEACEGRKLSIWISDEVLDTQLPPNPLQGLPIEPHMGTAVCATLSDSARIMIAGMIEDGTPSMDRLALCAGRSRRTLQRQLAAEGTSFAELFDSVRQDLAMTHLRGSGDSISSISQTLGYRNPSSLTRAVRRWTDTSPRRLRKKDDAV